MIIKSLFVSDVHLGSKACNPDALLDVLKKYEYNDLYIVGDFIDIWSLKRKMYWPQKHNDVIQKVLRLARRGVRVHYILGNHDEGLRDFLPLELGDNIKIMNESCIDIQGNKYLIIHGDLFDNIVKYHKWVAILGDIGYQFLISLNKYLVKIQNIFRKKPWSLSKYVKTKVKSAVSFIDDYENSVVQYVNENNYYGVICGHIHQSSKRNINGIEYLNCGDFCESLTYIILTQENELVVKHHEKDTDCN